MTLCTRVFFAIIVLSTVKLRAGFADEPTVFLVVRHAEKAGESGDVDRSEAGRQRAEVLCDLSTVLRTKAVYATAAKRAQQTATPTATAVTSPVQTYGEINETWAKNLKLTHAHSVTLIVGHSDTVPLIVQLLGGPAALSVGDKFDMLFVVAIDNDGQAAVAQLRYGESSP